MKLQSKVIPLGLAAVSLLVFSVAYGQQNKFKLKPDAKGKLCLSCHDNFKEKLKNRFVHTPVKTGNAQNAITLIPLPTGSYWTKIRIKYAISAMKELCPRIPKAVTKL